MHYRCSDQILANETILRFIKNFGAPNLEVSITKGGDCVFEREFTLVSDEVRDSGCQGIFLLASLVKTITSFAVIKLSENYGIDLDHCVLDVIPEVRSCSNIDGGVRILDLLDHTACIRNMTYDWGRYDDEGSKLGVLESFTKTDYKFSVDRRASGTWMYSNVGYDVLGAIIERVSGTSFENFVQSKILDPLKMMDTVFDLNSIDESRLRYPAFVESSKVFPQGEIPNVKRHSPSALAFSSIGDISKWGVFHATKGGLCEQANISALSRVQMWSPRVDTNISYSRSYGLGWYVGEWFGRPIVGHGGKELGFNTLIIIFPEDEISISILMNTEKAETISLAAEIAETLIRTGVMH